MFGGLLSGRKIRLAGSANGGAVPKMEAFFTGFLCSFLTGLDPGDHEAGGGRAIG